MDRQGWGGHLNRAVQESIQENKSFKYMSEGLHLDAVTEMSHENVRLFQAKRTTNTKALEVVYG